MLIDFNKMDTERLEQFKGGQGALCTQGYADALGKILRGHLDAGSTVGLHTHVTSSETIYVLSGTATAVVDGVAEELRPGLVTYCPRGSAHEIIDVCPEGLDFLAVVPEHSVAE